jgi:integrase
MPKVIMTAAWVERLKPEGDDRVEYFDTKVTGLGLRLSPSGKRVWFVHYRVRGDATKKRLTLEPYPQMTLADARERAQEVVLNAARGQDAAHEKQEERKAPTFAHVAEEYIERYAKGPGPEPRKRSWHRDEALLKKEVLPYWGKMKLHEIQRRDVNALLDRIQDRGAPIQANRILALVRKVFNWAISRDLIQYSPCIQVKPVAPENKRERVLSDFEIRAIWAAFEKQGFLIENMFKLRLLTAQRGGEVETMRWADVDLESGWWTIPAERAKNKRSHRVPLSAPAQAILSAIQERTGSQEWVFPSPTRKGQHIKNIQKAALRVQDASGVDFVMHDLRRTAATYLGRMKVGRFVIERILNHSDSDITAIYDRHSYDDEKRAALDVWANHLTQTILAPERTIGTVAT